VQDRVTSYQMDELRADESSSRRDQEEARRAFVNVDAAPIDPRAKEAALLRLGAASDEELAVFEGKLRADAFAAGASEREIREVQSTHPEHG
jgi:hypothetical protein